MATKKPYVSEATYQREKELILEACYKYEHGAITDDEFWRLKNNFHPIESQYYAQVEEEERRESDPTYKRNALLRDLTYTVGKVGRLWGALHNKEVLDKHYNGDRAGTERRYEKERDLAFNQLAACCEICPLIEGCPMSRPKRLDRRSLMNQLINNKIISSFRDKVKRDLKKGVIRSCVDLISPPPNRKKTP
jgi:hypothetical protein